MCNSAADAVRVVDTDFVERRAILEHHLEVRPFFGDARSQEQARSVYPKSKDALKACAIHPAGSAGIPGPAATADVRSDGVHVRRNNVGFDLVAMHVGACARAVDGIEE